MTTKTPLSIVLTPKVTEFDPQGIYRELPVDEWKWSYSRSSVPKLLAQRGIPLDCWQATFDSVKKARARNIQMNQLHEKQKREAMERTKLAMFFLYVFYILLIILIAINLVESDLSVTLSILCILSIGFLGIALWHILGKVYYNFLVRDIKEDRRMSKFAWTYFCEKQNTMYREKGNIRVSLEGIVFGGGITSLYTGLKFELLDDDGQPLSQLCSNGNDIAKKPINATVLEVIGNHNQSSNNDDGLGTTPTSEVETKALLVDEIV